MQGEKPTLSGPINSSFQEQTRPGDLALNLEKKQLLRDGAATERAPSRVRRVRGKVPGPFAGDDDDDDSRLQKPELPCRSGPGLPLGF